jgi:uracil-DNA glycosylase family 4
MEKAARVEDLSRYIEACTRCPYSQTRSMAFTGGGNLNSPLMLIGEGIRQNDDKEKQIYAKRAGAKLDSMLTEAGLNPGAIYRTVLIRCYGGRQPDQSPWSAYKKCKHHTLDLIKIIRPKVLILSGYNPFLWLVVRYTREQVKENDFHKWIGKIIRLKQVWGEMKLLIIETPVSLSGRRQPDSERKSIEGLTEIKEYVAAQIRGESAYPLSLIDLKSRGKKDADEQLKFSFGATDEPKPQAAPAGDSAAPSA